MSILETVLSVLGGGVLGSAATAWAKRGAAREETAQAREESATAVVPDLRDVIREMRTEVRDARAEVRAVQSGREEDRRDYESALESLQEGTAAAIRASDERCEETRKADRAAMERKIDERDRRCEQRLDALRADLGYVAARVSQSGDDDTGLHRIVRKSPTPPEGVPALMVHTGPRTLADVPPPKSGKGD